MWTRPLTPRISSTWVSPLDFALRADACAEWTSSRHGALSEAFFDRVAVRASLDRRHGGGVAEMAATPIPAPEAVCVVLSRGRDIAYYRSDPYVVSPVLRMTFSL